MKTSNKELWILLLFSTIVLLSTCGIYSPMESSDARYLEIGREMFLSGDYIHPNLLNIHHYHKPPVTYQLASLGYEIFGVNPFGGRFFLQISILLQIYLVYKLAILLTDNLKVAIYSSYIYSSFILVLSASRSLTTDSFLSLFALLGIIFWILYDKNRDKAIYLYCFSLAMALGFLSKGPVVFIVPVTFIAIYRYFFKQNRQWKYEHIIALILFIIVGGSWYFYLIWENHNFFDYFTLRQTVERFASRVFHRDEPFYYYWILTPLLGLPWLGIVPYLIKKVKLAKIDRVLLFTSVAVLIFFSLSHSKRILYILPLMPIFAIFTSHLLTQINQSDKFIQRFVTGYITILFIAMFTAPISNKISMPWWIYIVLTVAILIIFRLKSSIKSLITASLIANFTLLGYFSVLARYNPVLVHSDAQILTTWLKNKNLDRYNIIVYDKRLPSLSFNLNKSIISVYDKSPDLNREIQFETNNTYKRYYYNLNKKDEITRLKSFMKDNPHIIITKKGYPHKDRLWLINGMKRVDMGKWSIYY